jgi:hypothetical protein
MRRHFLILATLVTFIFLGSCKDLREETVYFLDIQGDIVSLEGRDRGDGLMDHLECSVSVINHGNVVSSLTYAYINTEEFGTIEGRFIGLVFKNLGNLETSFVIDLPYATPSFGPKNNIIPICRRRRFDLEGIQRETSFLHLETISTR